MLKNLTVHGFYNEKAPLKIDFSNGLTILTGDNGAGKTTLLNLVFNILNGDFVLLNKNIFKKIILELDTEDHNDNTENQLINKIVIDKSSEDLNIEYYIDKNIYIIQLKREHFHPFLDYTYDFTSIQSIITRKEKIQNANQNHSQFNSDFEFNDDNFEPVDLDFEFNDDDFEPVDLDFELAIEDSLNPYCETLSELIEQYPELAFIDFLKKDVLYFPTYRRIDSDIIHLLEQNYPVNNEKALYEFNRSINNFPNDRRVVGVNDNDIEHLYRSYSEECRKLNSEGLDSVLKSFIEEMLSTYMSNQPKERNETPSDQYDMAPEQLIDLSKQLNISNIDEEEIKNYFIRQKKIAQLAEESPKFSINQGSSKHKKNQKRNFKNIEDYYKQYTEHIILNNFLATNNNNLVMRLINLYDQHMKKVNHQLKPYEYLNKCFNNFFKGKITLDLDNYTIKLSQPFKNLSTGEKQLITMLSYAALSLKTQKYKPLIIIDEPELSLHISWQLNFLNALLDLPNVNVILATHSPYIANSDFEDSIWQLGEIDGY
ncbi:hypothetical protein CN335_12545 [Bacillus thuringiensis]|uniref:AAA family ATPase n=1 Tax=Bacillus thuringiensis TaxID=1428 RepID=UPI000BFA731C|nr:AAA family ATPase [Bacillus thuringiensis]PFF39001.1 hypothetical protein CN335_12545 [Bacillus thuringiensis]PFT16209.1 hypothetical protein COK83_11525 [Bacillus thuringiensis]HEB2439599.1 AAA family ATPase [Bacillus thuringiensis]